MLQLTVQRTHDTSSFQPGKKRSSFSNRYAYRTSLACSPIRLAFEAPDIHSITHNDSHPG